MRVSSPLSRLLQFVVASSIAAPTLAGVQQQAPGADHVAIEAEYADEILNPDAANDVQDSVQTGNPESPARIWAIGSATAASGGTFIAAPPTPHRQQNAPSLPETIAVYRFNFQTAGTYKAYFRVSNNGVVANGSSDSFWGPAGFGTANPSVNTTTGTTGAFEWLTNYGQSFVVSPAQVGNTLEFRVSSRESGMRLDGLVLSLQDALDSTALDALLAAAPQPEETDPTPTPTPAPTATPCSFTTRTVSSVSQFNTAVAASCPGDTVVLSAAADWTNVTLYFDGLKTTSKSGGTADYPITLKAERSGEVVLRGNSYLRISGSYMVVDGLKFAEGASTGNGVIEFRRDSDNLAYNCRLSNTAIVNYSPTDPLLQYAWVSVYGENNRVNNCYFAEQNHVGVTLIVWPTEGGPPNNTRIDNNYFAGRPELVDDANGYETIRIGTSTVSQQQSNAIVERNLFERCDGEIEVVSNKSVGNIYRYNTFRECKGQLTLRHGAACRVEGNFFLQNNYSGSSAIRIIGPDHVVINNYIERTQGTSGRAGIGIVNGVVNSPLSGYLQAERCVVAFNTLVNCREGIAIGVDASNATLPPKDCIIANNVVLSSSGQNSFRVYTTPENLTWQGNIAFGGSTGISPVPTGVTVTNPRLAVSGDGLYRPEPNSPLLDGATGSWSTVTVDMDGEMRTDGVLDIGADETTTSGAVQRRPLTAEDVGPDWMRTTVKPSGWAFIGLTP
ncbi:hypothetical protein GC173_05245 [bacterium]|nr:hypothetical protein [bacterium]